MPSQVASTSYLVISGPSHPGQVSPAMVTCTSTSTGTQVQGSIPASELLCYIYRSRNTTGIHINSTFCLKIRKGKANIPLGSISLPGSSHMSGILVAYAWWRKWRNSQDWCSFHVPCEYRWLSETRVVKNFLTELKITKLCCSSLPFSS